MQTIFATQPTRKDNVRSPDNCGRESVSEDLTRHACRQIRQRDCTSEYLSVLQGLRAAMQNHARCRKTKQTLLTIPFTKKKQRRRRCDSGCENICVSPSCCGRHVHCDEWIPPTILSTNREQQRSLHTSGLDVY